jgi:hypothetical protein
MHGIHRGMTNLGADRRERVLRIATIGASFGGLRQADTRIYGWGTKNLGCGNLVTIQC